jgi:hypothetical protein
LTEQRQSAIGVLVDARAATCASSSCVHVARAEGVGPRDLPTRLGVPPFVVDQA